VQAQSLKTPDAFAIDFDKVFLFTVRQLLAGI
jgi:hypothetical protein